MPGICPTKSVTVHVGPPIYDVMPEGGGKVCMTKYSEGHVKRSEAPA